MATKKLGSVKHVDTLLVTSANLASEVTGILGVANGGTGQTTFTDGQLLIGNTTGNTLAKATLTAGANIVVTNGAGSITLAVKNNIASAPQTLTDAATIATDASLGNRFRCSSATDRTLGAPTNPTDGQQCLWRWKNTDAASHTLTLASGAGGFRFGSDITALSATAAGKADYITAEYNATDDRWDIIGYLKGY